MLASRTMTCSCFCQPHAGIVAQDGRKFCMQEYGNITCPSSYATGGFNIDFSDRFVAIDSVEIGLDIGSSGVVLNGFNQQITGTNVLFKLNGLSAKLNANLNTITLLSAELLAGTNCSGITLRYLVHGSPKF